MESMIKMLRTVADPTRVRILTVLAREDLSVAELQEILSMGQSRISSQLAQLKRAGLVADRRSGKNIIYTLNHSPPEGEPWASLFAAVALAAREIEETPRDAEGLALALAKREDKMRAYFDQLAGKFGRSYCPGRSWKALAETLLKLMPPLVIADLGAGEGTFSQLLAQRANRVIAIDNSQKMVEFGAKLAREHGLTNLEYRLGDIQDPPIDDASVDLAFFSQALHHARNPAAAVQSAYRILKPGGTIVVLDLLVHSFEEARELYADIWLGFSEAKITGFLNEAGFIESESSIVSRESEPPHFQTLLAIARKPAEDKGA